MNDSHLDDHLPDRGDRLTNAFTNAAPEDPTYVLGRSETETQRLMLQAELYGRAMQRFFQEAGVGPGMRVLDVGGALRGLVASDATGIRQGVDGLPAVPALVRPRPLAAHPGGVGPRSNLIGVAVGTDFATGRKHSSIDNPTSRE